MSRKSEPLPIQTVRIVDKLRGEGLDWKTVGARTGIPPNTLRKKYKESKIALGEKIPPAAKKEPEYDIDKCHYKVCRGCHWWRTVGALGRVCNFTADTGIIHKVRDCQIAGRPSCPAIEAKSGARARREKL